MNIFNTFITEPADYINKIYSDETSKLELQNFIEKCHFYIGQLRREMLEYNELAMIEVLNKFEHEHLLQIRMLTDLFQTYKNNSENK